MIIATKNKMKEKLTSQQENIYKRRDSLPFKYNRLLIVK